ncbi:hypothetical protein [Budvicia aquatica]|uniref:Uncharacterized protein n=1 Tax=Budvicia aquatica TaxID=82979 RepID=A0A484ZTW9_9GAMM|nr:hypothetical protein [Budvicia aquatica]VFS51952.1 Uncharacterised protein [Budvicia aquatica]
MNIDEELQVLVAQETVLTFQHVDQPRTRYGNRLHILFILYAFYPAGRLCAGHLPLTLL